MITNIKQTYLDKLVRKPVPKSKHRFLNSDTPSNDSESGTEVGTESVTESVLIVDKRKSMVIQCETVWEKINRRVGTVFDKRKIRQGDRAKKTGVSERYTSDYLETVLGKRPAKSIIPKQTAFPKVSDTEVEPEVEKEVESETEPQETEPQELEKDVESQEPDVESQEVESQESESQEPEVPKVKGRKSKKSDLSDLQAKTEKLKLTAKTQLNGQPILPRLPKHDKILMRTSPYYMSNRKLYMQKLAELFKNYNPEIAKQMSTASCSNQASEDFQLLIHQRIVRDYLNMYTPYRGLLLYHGLGSGKTCTSIALAEGMKSHRKIYVMTPASLKMNFFSELKKCGDSLYKKKQHWEFVSVVGQPENVPILSKALSLPVEFILKNKGAWLMDVSKHKSNFAELTANEQKTLDAQLNAMIRTKYVDINYNGINETYYRKLTRNEANEEINPFDGATVLIDEAHNFVSRVSNKLKAPESISYKLYQKLIHADNARIVLMTGTPMINYPNELGVLYNILRGVIRTWVFSVKGDERLVKEQIIRMFKEAGLNTYDYIDYANGELTITRNPFGFVNSDTPTISRAKGGGKSDKDSDKRSDKPSDKRSEKRSEKADKHSEKSDKPSDKHSDKDDKETKTKSHSATKKIKLKIRKDIQIKGTRKNTKADTKVDTKVDTKEELVPSVRQEKSIEDPDKVELPYSDELAEINDVMEEQVQRELQEYANGMADPHMGGDPLTDKSYKGVYYNEQGNISDAEFIKRVKQVFRDNGIEVVGMKTPEPYKALPDDPESFLQMFVEEGAIQVKNIPLFKKRILGLTSYFRSAQESLLPQFVKTEKDETYHIVSIPMSEHQLKTYFRIRVEELKTEKSQKAIQESAKELYKTASTYRIFSRSACNFAFPPDIPRPMPNPAKTKKNMTEDEMDNTNDNNAADVYINENAAIPIEDEEYQERIRMALAQLAAPDKTSGVSPFLSREGLKTVSPKFLKMLENIENPENKGLHLVYSNFRSLEGIGIFKQVLEANGFAEFKLTKNGDVWEIVEPAPENADKPKFALYTGTETAEEKEIVRNIYNGQWELVPASIVAKLREKHENNHLGEIIKVFMITASGAEGINLANTRFVHIMEPYWHMVRVDQVIGRARRICSHKDLPKELQTVQVFLYVSVFSDTQRVNTEYKDIMTRQSESSRINKKRAITTDENLYEIALLKENINGQLLKAIKETAIDCRLYKKGNASENLVCYGEGLNIQTNDFGIFPSWDMDKLEREDINVREQQVKPKKITIPGKSGEPAKVYIRIGEELFDADAYENSKDLVLVAKYRNKEVVPISA